MVAGGSRLRHFAQTKAAESNQIFKQNAMPRQSFDSCIMEGNKITPYQVTRKSVTMI